MYIRSHQIYNAIALFPKLIFCYLQVKALKQRIALLEEESMGYKGSMVLQSQSSGASETSL